MLAITLNQEVNMRMGWGEIVVILAVALLLFGAKRLPDIARSIGKSVKELKRGLNGSLEEDDVKKTKDGNA